MGWPFFIADWWAVVGVRRRGTEYRDWIPHSKPKFACQNCS